LNQTERGNFIRRVYKKTLHVRRNDIINETLARKGIEERVDHHSYERQGIDQIPTVHMGVAVLQMERRGIVTERGNYNREINERNKQLRSLNARIRKLEDWVKENKTNQPDLA
jgi:hypothetical protein